MSGRNPATLPPLSPAIVALPAYNAGMTMADAERLSGRRDLARLASNENPDGCAPGVLAALSGGALEPWRYSDHSCARLRAALAAATGRPADTIVVGNGSEEMILAAARVLLEPGAQLLTVLPSFGLHGITASSVGAHTRHVPMSATGDFDVDALCTALAGKPRLLALSSPWNPVGTALDATALARLLAAADPTTTAILHDEAYFEYGYKATRPDAPAMLADWGGHWVVLRSFSKAYGLAGLRVGYALCAGPDLAHAMTNAKTPFNVNAAAQAGALAALEDQAWMEASVARCATERCRVATALAGLGFAVPPSQTNFLFIDTGGDSDACASELLRAGIIVKAWREAGFERYLRATIGTKVENDRLIDAMTDWIDALRRGQGAAPS